MELTLDDLQDLAVHLGLLVGYIRRAPFPLLVAVLERRGYDERALGNLARLHPHEAHKLVMGSGSRGRDRSTAASAPDGIRSHKAEP
jgi:hypothetical protein